MTTAWDAVGRPRGGSPSPYSGSSRRGRARVTVAAAMLVVETQVVPAFGRPPPVDYGPQWPPPPRCTPSDREVERAIALYRQGAKAYGDRDFERAFILFRDALLIDCQALVLLNNMSKALESQGRYVEAAEMLRLYIDRRNPTGEELRVLHGQIEKLEHLAADPVVPMASASAPAPTSTEATTPSPSVTPPISPTVSPMPTSTSWVEPIASPPPASTTRSLRPLVGWMMVGGGLAAATAGAVMAGLGASQAGRIRDLRHVVFEEHTCAAESCGSDLNHINQQVSRADVLQAAGWVTLGLGAVSAVGGALFMTLGRHGDRPRPDIRTQLDIRFGWTGTMLSVSGVF